MFEDSYRSMVRYVAVIAHLSTAEGQSPAAQLVDRFRRLRPDWQLFAMGEMLSVFYLPPNGRHAEAVLMPGRAGVILGTLFPNDLRISPLDWRAAIGAKQAQQILRTRGRYLIDNFWGGYVAIFHDDVEGVRYVFRDCSGKIPCYEVRRGDATIIASNINDLRCFDLAPFSLDHKFIAGFVMEAELAHGDCGLREVKELLAGHCLELKNGRTQHVALWDPRVVARENMVEDFDDAARQVRAVTQGCIDFWASRYDRIVHLLSGGVDSSVVLGCLMQSPQRPHIVCLHYESGGSDRSEYQFAQLAAAGMDLKVQPGYSSQYKYDHGVLSLPKSAKPSVSNLSVALNVKLKNNIPMQAAAEAIWDGQGGDHLFFQSRSAFEAVDFAYRHGLTADFLGHVRGAARLSRASYWSILGKSIRLGLFRASWHPRQDWPRTTGFLHPDIPPSDLVDYVWQPWLADACDLPPGKRLQICLLAWLIHRHRPIPELQFATEHHPLFSQPLFELCLRIPIYTLLQSGVDRALERAAFRDLVPEPIIRRENKGSVVTAHMEKIRQSLPFIRDLLLGGVLVNEKIVNQSALEPYLAGNRPLNHAVLWPFLSCLSAEVWARQWTADGWRI